MQKYRLFFLFNITVLLVVTLFYPIQLLGQTNSELVSLYENNQLLKLKEYSDNNKIYDTHWKAFIKALFEQNADSALDIFTGIYNTTNDKLLQRIIIERISDYYYARGYYITSERILKDKKFFRETISVQQESKTDAIKYGIQIGAFSSYKNASNLKNKILKKANNVAIINKDTNGDNLYVVVIGKYSNRNEAEKELQALQQKNIIGYIIQY